MYKAMTRAYTFYEQSLPAVAVFGTKRSVVQLVTVIKSGLRIRSSDYLIAV
jgi:hypothetical protein